MSIGKAIDTSFASPDSNPHLPPLMEEEEHQLVDKFESTRAKLVAFVMWYGAFGTFGINALEHSRNWYERAMVLAFYTSTFTIPHVWVHRPKTPGNVLGFSLSLAVLLLLPQTDLCRRHSHIGAMHGSASVFNALRSLQYYLNQEEFAGWKPFRRMYFISTWGWHDFRKIKYVGEQRAKEFLRNELFKLARSTMVILTSAGFLKWWGKPQKYSLDMYRFLLMRWTAGFFMLVAWFDWMDAFPRALHLWADNHELKPISMDPWNAGGLKEFWRRWDLPVQEMLAMGVYSPISSIPWLGPHRKRVARIAVFLLSALGHTYAISCGGLARRHLLAMFLFFMAQPPLLLAESVFKFRGALWMFLAELPVAPLFIEPCLTFVHL